jgi:RNA polymerase sigma-70 factor (family 1)
MSKFSNDICRAYTDTQLLELLSGGDETAFTELYNRYHAPLYHYLLHFVKSPNLAEDLVHEVFLKLWTMRDRLQVNSSLSAYLYRICHNMGLDALKKIARDKTLRHEVLEWLRPVTDERDADVAAQEQLLAAAVAKLPPQRQRVFQLCRLEGKTYEEAARELGISRHTIKEHMVLSLKTLRGYVAEKDKLLLALLLVQALS